MKASRKLGERRGMGPARRSFGRRLSRLMVSLSVLAGFGSAEGAGYRFRIPDAASSPGARATLTVEGEHDVSIQGFSLSIRYPAASLSIEEVHFRDTILDAIGIDYFQATVDPGAGSLVIGALADAEPPFDGTRIPTIGRALPFLYVEARVAPGAAGDLPVDFVDGLGTPPVANLFVVDDYPVAPQELIGGAVRLPGPEPRFLRGDATVDGRSELSDAIRILDYQFRGGAVLECFDAADVNDDAVLDIADPIFLLQFLFIGGPTPPEPTWIPGTDPTPDRLDCATGLDG